MLENENPGVQTPTEVPAVAELDVQTPAPESAPEEKGQPLHDANKLVEQINNLNIAISEERKAKKADAELIKTLQEKLDSTEGVLSRMKDVFAPPAQQQQLPGSGDNANENPGLGLTVEQLEEFWARKEQEKIAQTKEQEQIAAIQREIQEMEQAWDGKEGKPKYSDEEIVQWQRENGKLHLSPKTAFFEKYHNEIVDYEVSRRLGQRPAVQSVERPGGATTPREPASNGQLKTREELRAAVSEAIANAMSENNT